jgi:5-methylcytosine-specific restriction endonuclease McrA
VRYTGPDNKTRSIVKARDGGCVRCDTVCPTHIHHRKPRRAGGTSDRAINSPANLVSLCPACHSQIESWRQLGYQTGYLLHANDDPTVVPILSAGYRVWLDGDGGRTSQRITGANPVIWK